MSSPNRTENRQYLTPQLIDDTQSCLALSTQAARSLAVSKAEQDLRDCIAFGQFLTEFQLAMLNRSPWSAEQYAAIEDAEIEVSTRMAIAIARLDDLIGGIS